MKITVYNKKGGAGKTPIAVNLALTLGYAIGANENNRLGKIFPQESIIEIEPEEEFPAFPNHINIVFDLGGVLSRTNYSVLTAIKQSDLVLIPIFWDTNSIEKGLETYHEVASINPNIFFLATRLKTRYGDLKKSDPAFSWEGCKEFRDIDEAITEGTGSKQVVLPLQESDFYHDMYNKGQTFQQLRDEWPLQRRNIQKVVDQFDLVFKEIEKYETQ